MRVRITIKLRLDELEHVQPYSKVLLGIITLLKGCGIDYHLDAEHEE